MNSTRVLVKALVGVLVLKIKAVKKGSLQKCFKNRVSSVVLRRVHSEAVITFKHMRPIPLKAGFKLQTPLGRPGGFVWFLQPAD